LPESFPTRQGKVQGKFTFSTKDSREEDKDGLFEEARKACNSSRDVLALS